MFRRGPFQPNPSIGPIVEARQNARHQRAEDKRLAGYFGERGFDRPGQTFGRGQGVLEASRKWGGDQARERFWGSAKAYHDLIALEDRLVKAGKPPALAAVTVAKQQIEAARVRDHLVGFSEAGLESDPTPFFLALGAVSIARAGVAHGTAGAIDATAGEVIGVRPSDIKSAAKVVTQPKRWQDFLDEAQESFTRSTGHAPSAEAPPTRQLPEVLAMDDPARRAAAAAESAEPRQGLVQALGGETPGPGRAVQDGRPASAPVGSRRSPNDNLDWNAPTTIGGREYSGHAVDRMQGRGIPPSAVENTIQHGVTSPGKSAGTLCHYDQANDITVITNASSGRVVTVSHGEIKQ